MTGLAPQQVGREVDRSERTVRRVLAQLRVQLWKRLVETLKD
jgi:hypothetical protein